MQSGGTSSSGSAASALRNNVSIKVFKAGPYFW